MDPTASAPSHPPGDVRLFVGRVSSRMDRTSVLNLVASMVSNIETTMLATEGLNGALTIPQIG